jgi:general secretion pathway protein E
MRGPRHEDIEVGHAVDGGALESIPQTLEWVLAPRAEIASYIARHEQGLRALDAAVVGNTTEGSTSGSVDNLSLASISQDSSPIVKLVHSTLYDALRAGASDVHLETLANGLVVRYRIDGVLVQMASVSGDEVSEQVISRIKVMAELDIAERRVPQDGRFKVAIDGRAIDFRVSIIPSVFGEDAVLRVLDKQSLTEKMHGLTLEALGFDAAIVSQLRRLSSLPVSKRRLN